MHKPIFPTLTVNGQRQRNHIETSDALLDAFKKIYSDMIPESQDQGNCISLIHAIKSIYGVPVEDVHYKIVTLRLRSFLGNVNSTSGINHTARDAILNNLINTSSDLDQACKFRLTFHLAKSSNIYVTKAELDAIEQVAPTQIEDISVTRVNWNHSAELSTQITVLLRSVKLGSYRQNIFHHIKVDTDNSSLFPSWSSSNNNNGHKNGNQNDHTKVDLVDLLAEAVLKRIRDRIKLDWIKDNNNNNKNGSVNQDDDMDHDIKEQALIPSVSNNRLTGSNFLYGIYRFITASDVAEKLEKSVSNGSSEESNHGATKDNNKKSSDLSNLKPPESKKRKREEVDD